MGQQAAAREAETRVEEVIEPEVKPAVAASKATAEPLSVPDEPDEDEEGAETEDTGSKLKASLDLIVCVLEELGLTVCTRPISHSIPFL